MVRPKTELFLYHLLWSAESLIRPTFRNLNQSFEGWAYRNGLARQIAHLEKEGLIERKAGAMDNRIVRLTERGRLRALGGRDPIAQWGRHWDGYWRLVLFDVPTTRNTERSQLRRYLRNKSFGLLQRSVWITPDSLTEESLLLHSARPDVGALVLLEATACAGESDQDMVGGAWDFERINKAYQHHMDIVAKRPERIKGDAEAKQLRAWGETEWRAWRAAVAADPLLPRALWPRGYLGERAWRRRIECLAHVKRQMSLIAW